MKHVLASFAVAALAQMCAITAHAHAGAVRPAQAQTADTTTIAAGTYELSVAFGGGLLEATLEIAYVRDSMTAVLKLGDHESPVKAGARRGNKLTLEPKSAGTDVRYELEFSGATVKGTFTYQGDTGTVTGKRRANRS
jgi:hypothetical protein